MASFDSLFLKKYDIKRYNCLHFLVDVWQELFAIDLSFMFASFIIKDGLMYKAENVQTLYTTFKKTQVERPMEKGPTREPCLCLCRGFVPHSTHVATWHHGRLFDILENGVRFLPLEVALLGFSSVSYYEYHPHNN